MKSIETLAYLKLHERKYTLNQKIKTEIKVKRFV